MTAWLSVLEAEIAWKKAVLVAKLLFTLFLSCDFIFRIKSHSDSWLNQACLF